MIIICGIFFALFGKTCDKKIVVFYVNNEKIPFSEKYILINR